MRNYEKVFKDIFKKYGKKIENKCIILNDIINNDNLDFSKISQELANKLEESKRVLLVGNGPIHKNILDEIPNFDTIIRFNNYYDDNPKDLVGSKTDIQFICLDNNWGNFYKCIKRSSYIIPIELGHPDRYKLINTDIRDNIIIPELDYIENLKKSECDITRGFYGLSICLQTKFKKNEKLEINIIGFGGDGHHFNKNHKMLHGHDLEKIIINELKAQNFITDLNC